MTDETAIVAEPTAYPSLPDPGVSVPFAATSESADAELAGDQSSPDEADSSLEQDSSNDESPSNEREELPLLGDAPVAFTEGTSATIEGHLEEIVFRNEREGFTVGNFRLSDGRALTVVGPLASAVLEAPVIISGAFARDPRFGLQFHITETLDPLVSEEVAQAYLASGLIPYIGAAGAAEIVAAAGSQTLRMLATHPDSLLDYRGITPRRLPAIKRALRETLALAPVVGLLGLAIERAQAEGREARKLSLRAAKRIHRRYGASAAEIIRANPWRMAKEIAGVGFRSADNVAIGLGCPLDSPTRLEAAVLGALRTAAVEEGHIVYPGTVLEADAVKLAIRPNAEARAAIERLVKSGEILHIERPEGYALPRLAEAEKLIAAKLRVIVAFADANPIVVNEEDIDEVERDENEALSAFSRLSDTGPTAVSLPNPHLPQASEGEPTKSGTTSGLVTSANAVVPANAVAPGNAGGPAHRELPMMAGLDTPAGVFHFDVSQRRAIRKALEDRVTIITGQPGTGKTTLVRAILDLADDHGLSSALVSPTGRAAKRLSEATGRPAQTIHRFLRYHPDEGFRGPETLPDVLVVDEVSMLDSPLAAHLFGALPPFVRLILVGDEDQLPAVGPGNVLGDLLGAPAVNVLRLSTIHRTASGSGIPALARQIRIGVRKPVYDRVTTRFIARGDDPTQKPAEQAADIAAWIAETIERYKDRIDEFQILCPMRRTACGTEALNRMVQNIVNPGPHPRSIRREGFNLCPGDRILVTENDYVNGLFNGDVGRLLDITSDGRLVTSFDGIERVLPPDAGGGFTLAYAMTTHKCVSTQERIPVIGKGFIPIGEAQVGDMTPHGEIKGLWRTQKPEIVIRTKRGYEVSCSAEHRWVTARGLMATQDIQIGDRIELANIPSFPGTGAVDPEFAWFIGYLVGDGNYTDIDDGTLHMSCTTPELGARYQAYLISRGLHSAMRKDQKGYHSSSRPFRKELLDLGLDYVKGPVKKIPHAIWESGPKAWAGFLQGLFDADGSVARTVPMIFTTSSVQLGKEVQMMLLALNIQSKRYSFHVPGYPAAYWQIMVTAAWIDKYKSLIGFSEPKKREKLARFEPRKVMTHLTGYDEIIEISATEREIDMMDIEIPAPHLISFSGFMGHNSQGSEFPIVIIPMTTSFFKMLERRLLYTAVSRARQTVAIVGQQKAVSIAIGTHDTRARRTLLLEYLTASVGPQMTVLSPSDVPEDELF